MQYPFTPELLDALPEELAELYRDLELKLLEEICSRLVLADQLNEVTVQDIRALRAQGINLEDIERAIRKATGISEAKLNQLLDDVVERNRTYYGELANLAHITAPEAIVSDKDIQAIHDQTMGDFRNITRSMGFLVRQGQYTVKLPPAKAYQWALDRAEMQVMSGAISYNQAIAETVRELADSGLVAEAYIEDKQTETRYPAVRYESKSGKIRYQHIDVCVRRAVMSGVNQVCDKYTNQSAEFLNTRYFEISAHSGARDKPGPNPWSSHKAWQGRVFYWSEYGEPDPRGEYKDLVDSTGYGYVDGLTGANCRHHKFCFLPGLSERTYTDEQLAHIDDGLGCDFEGRHYTAYEATQKQRDIETAIRDARRKKTAFEAAGCKEEAQAQKIRLRRLNQKYRDFSKAAGLPEQWERTKVYKPTNMPSNVGKPVVKPVSLRYNEVIQKYVSIDAKTVYQDAKSGLRHAGIYRDAINKGQAALEKSIASHTAQVEEHMQKIKIPEKYDTGWAVKDERQRQGLLRKWEKDLRRNAEQAEIEIEVWKARFGKDD